LATAAPALVAFDVDGTLLRGETVCECIGRSIGRLEETRAFEALTSRADIAAGRRAMLQWYREHDQARLLDCLDAMTLAPGASLGLARLRECGIKVALVSTTWQFAVTWLAQKLGADYAIGTSWLETGDVVDFWPEDKASWLADLMRTLGVSAAQLVAVGDSAGDIPMLKLAGRGYFVGRTMPQLPPHVRHWPNADIAKLAEHVIGKGR
jgi:HAD superfamily phosphoserine phosphatase-like hydrolase